MWKYIVTWVLVTRLVIPCPQSDKGSPYIDNQILCMEEKRDTLRMEFTQRPEAISFIKEGEKIIEFSLDSVKINPPALKTNKVKPSRKR